MTGRVKGLRAQLDVTVDHDEAEHLDTVCAVALHSHQPADRHWNILMKVMGCLHGTRGVD